MKMRQSEKHIQILQPCVLWKEASYGDKLMFRRYSFSPQVVKGKVHTRTGHDGPGGFTLEQAMKVQAVEK
jgi:hypothetical protein